jgi:predicted peptidase
VAARFAEKHFMRTRSLFVAAAVAVSIATFTAMSQQLKPDPHQQVRSITRKVTRTLTIQYLLFLPKDYAAKPARKWPLILFLHGAGERGRDLWLVTKHGPPKIVRDKPDFPFIVVSPQCPEGHTWSNEVLLALLDEVLATCAIDPARVYLTGLSMGGYGTWSLGLAHPERFAAIAPICGGGDVIGILLPGSDTAQALKTLPVWAFHGAKDNVVRLAESERMVSALKQLGVREVELTVYPDAGHDSWTETYDNPKLYDWFLAHQRKPTPKKRVRPRRSPCRESRAAHACAETE